MLRAPAREARLKASLVWNIKAGQLGADPAGPVTLNIAVAGMDRGGEGSTTARIVVRALGDLDGSGGLPDALDKQNMNRRLNDIATGLPERCFDLNGDGTVDASDKQILNKVLNGIALP